VSTKADIAVKDGFFRGEDKSIVFDIVNAVGDPQDITGWTVSFRVASSKFGAAIIQKTVGSGITLTDPTAGRLTVVLASADTVAFTNDGSDADYSYVLRRTNAGSRTELAYGALVIQDTWVGDTGP
jgi:hypothetical protein